MHYPLNEQLVPSTNPMGLFPKWGSHMPCDSGFWHAVEVPQSPRILESYFASQMQKTCAQGQGGKTLEGQVSDLWSSVPSYQRSAVFF